VRQDRIHGLPGEFGAHDFEAEPISGASTGEQPPMICEFCRSEIYLDLGLWVIPSLLKGHGAPYCHDSPDHSHHPDPARPSGPSYADKVIILLNHLEDVLDDKNFERINPALWNAVSSRPEPSAPKIEPLVTTTGIYLSLERHDELIDVERQLAGLKNPKPALLGTVAKFLEHGIVNRPFGESARIIYDLIVKFSEAKYVRPTQARGEK